MGERALSVLYGPRHYRSLEGVTVPNMTESFPPQLVHITGTTTDHEEVDITGWAHSFTRRTDINTDYLYWEDAHQTRHIDMFTFVIDITVDGQRQELELTKCPVEHKEQP
jgi:hypothetical protein